MSVNVDTSTVMVTFFAQVNKNGGFLSFFFGELRGVRGEGWGGGWDGAGE